MIKKLNNILIEIGLKILYNIIFIIMLPLAILNILFWLCQELLTYIGILYEKHTKNIG